jgi:CRP/FNR family transcriptional regulator, cyclic AMP receptor protein
MPADTDIEAVLRGVSLFADVSPADLAALSSNARVRQYPPRQVVFNRGDPSETLIVVLSGRVQIIVRSVDGGELILAVLGAGEVLGEPSVVDGGARSADAQAQDATTLLILPREAVLALARRDAGVAMKMLAAVSATLRRLTDLTEDLVFLDLPRRVAKILLSVPLPPGGSADLGMTQEQMAHRVGGTRQSVNAALRGFERRGWIDTNGRHVTIKEVDALARFAGEVSGS